MHKRRRMDGYSKYNTQHYLRELFFCFIDMRALECVSLTKIYELIDSTKDIDEYKLLKNLAQKAYAAASLFNEQIDERFVANYLSDNLPIDALCALSLAVMYGSDKQSTSHQNWLRELRQLKLKWDWPESLTSGENKRAALMKSFTDLQNLAMRYPLLRDRFEI